MENIAGRLIKQQILRANGLCLISLGDRLYHASIIKLDDKVSTVKVLDSGISPDKWKILTIPTEELQPPEYRQHTNLGELLDHLKKTGTLQTLSIEQAFQQIDRAWFCPNNPYDDAGIDIGYNACISSPHMHVWALEMVKDLFPSADSILDIGVGSGHLTVLLAHLAPRAEVIGIEYIPELLEQAQTAIDNRTNSCLKSRIHLVLGDGEDGYDKGGPYDIINVGFMVKTIPSELIRQLKVGGKLVIPVANGKKSPYENKWFSDIYTLVEKYDNYISTFKLFKCSFVPSISSLSIKTN